MNLSIAFVYVTLVCVSCQVNPGADDPDNRFADVTAKYQNDSLKLAAANFLVRNMRGKQTACVQFYNPTGTEYAVVDGEADLQEKSLIDSLNLFYQTYYKHDIDSLNLKYLMANIELAFNKWSECPWRANVPFDQFCDYILPYRIGTEKLIDWRSLALKLFPWANDSIKRGIPMQRLICMLNDSLKTKFSFGDLNFRGDNSLTLSELLASKQGGCDAMANIALYVMRSFAIPVMKDFTPAWASANGGHSWNSVYLETGQLRSFMGCESCPNDREPNYYFPFDGHGTRISDRIYHRSGKVFRQTYSLQPDPFSGMDSDDIPSFFKSYSSIKDVTSEYMPTGDIKVKLKNVRERTKFAYICVFNTGKWVPIAWSLLSESQATFTNMGRDIVYLVGEYHDGIIRPLSVPFLFDESENVTFIVPDSNIRKKLILNHRSLYHPEWAIYPGLDYSLFCWQDGAWSFVQRKRASSKELEFSNIAINGLYQLRSSDSQGTERPFLFLETGLAWY